MATSATDTPPPLAQQTQEHPLLAVGKYHHISKHNIEKFAPGPKQHPSWSSQPNPFRRFANCPRWNLPLDHLPETPVYQQVAGGTLGRGAEVDANGKTTAEPLNLRTLSSFLHNSLALSATKRAGASEWHLRVTPSSGNLHSTEAYLLAPPLLPDGGGEDDQPQWSTGAVLHYCSEWHVLEQRATFDGQIMRAVEEGVGTASSSAPSSSSGARPSTFVVVLGSVFWRQAWKYGVRGFRYCMQDEGHAIAALRIAAAALGWRASIAHGVSHVELDRLIGADRWAEHGVAAEEREFADVAILVDTSPATDGAPPTAAVGPHSQLVDLTAASVAAIVEAADWSGTANQLSPPGSHVEWPDIDRVHEATRKGRTPGVARSRYCHVEAAPGGGEGQACDDVATASTTAGTPGVVQMASAAANRTVASVVRRRRSAWDMDGATAISAGCFYRLVEAVLPSRAAVPWDCAAWAAAVHLAVLVHRVEGLDPGLYIVARDKQDPNAHPKVPRGAAADLAAAVNPGFKLQTPAHCPPTLRPHIWQLHAADVRTMGVQVSCQQSVAGAGAFTLGMLADFRALMADPDIAPAGVGGPWSYRKLLWEAGMVGHVLYLEAELAGISATGLGCHMDDPFHGLLGFRDDCFQSIYHFAVGKALKDERLGNVDPYARAERPSPELSTGDIGGSLAA